MTQLPLDEADYLLCEGWVREGVAPLSPVALPSEVNAVVDQAFKYLRQLRQVTRLPPGKYALRLRLHKLAHKLVEKKPVANDDEWLMRQVQERHENVSRWFGRRSDGNTRFWICYVCREDIIAEDRWWQSTDPSDASRAAIREHGANHLRAAFLTPWTGSVR